MPANPTDLCAYSLSEIGSLIARREVSSAETTAAALDRIARIDPELNAFITVTRETALADARAADAAIARGDHLGPLHGVPLSLKDLLLTRGVRTTAGSNVLADYVPDRDAVVVQRLRAAGAVILGKTNMLEFAYGEIHPAFGVTRNPWNPAYGTAGSSSGSAAAVAAGLGYGSIGSDTGGSIRGPAAYCGIVGLKPTYGLVSRDGVLPLSWSLDHIGPMTRTVRDCALLLDAIVAESGGPNRLGGRATLGFAATLDPLDPPDHPLGRDRPHRPESRDALPVIGVIEPEDGDGVTDDTRRAVDATATALRGLGYRTRPVPLPHPLQAARALLAMMYAEASAYHLPWLRDRPEGYSVGTRERLELGTLFPATVYLQATRARAVIVAAYREIFETVDVLLLPISAKPSYLIDGQPARAERDAAALLDTTPESGDRILAGIRFGGPFNLTGQPAISVPCGATAAGLPIGAQLVGRPWSEAALLRVAAAVEAAMAGALPSRVRNGLLM